jgi:hypothetical protein
MLRQAAVEATLDCKPIKYRILWKGPHSLGFEVNCCSNPNFFVFLNYFLFACVRAKCSGIGRHRFRLRITSEDRHRLALCLLQPPTSESPFHSRSSTHRPPHITSNSPPPLATPLFPSLFLTSSCTVSCFISELQPPFST